MKDSLLTYYNELKSTYPAYYALRFAKSDQDRINFKKDVNAIIFFYGQRGIYSIACKEGVALEIVRTDNDDNFKNSLKDFLLIVRNPPALSRYKDQVGEFQNVANYLYDVLLEKPLTSLSSIEDVVIVPDGMLFSIPFEALVREATETNSFSRLNYIQNYYSVSYAYSLKSLKNNTRQMIPVDTVVAFGFSQNDKLFNSALELKQVATAMPMVAYTDLSASKTQILKSLQSEHIVHLSMHGESTGIEQGGYLLLPDKDTLFMGDLYDKLINAPLVTLNACKTSDGKLDESEGTLSLARALMFAGAESIVGNLWALDDFNGRKNIVNFYTYLAQNNSPQNALTFSKRMHISEGDNFTAHPFFWAGTILYGQPKFKEGVDWKTITALVSLSLVFVLLLYVVLQKRKIRAIEPLSHRQQ